MLEVTVRPRMAEDVEGFLEVLSRTYNDAIPMPVESVDDRELRQLSDFVGLVGDRVAGSYSELDFQISIGALVGECVGIAAVGVLPEFRRHGVASAMMKHAVRTAAHRHVPFLSLYPFRNSFYRKFGYENVGSRVKLSVSRASLPKVKSELPVRVLKPSDYELLEPVYHSYASKRAGCVLRTSAQWTRVLGENKDLTIYAVGEPLEAYIAINHSSSFHTTQHLSEVIYSSRKGYLGLIALMQALVANKSGLTWYESSDSPYMAEFVEQDVTIELARLIMMRIGSVKAALSKLTPTGSGRTVITVLDPLIEENSGNWAVSWEENAVTEIQKVDQTGVAFSVEQLTQVILGEPSYENLARNGLVAWEKDLSSLFTARPVICLDFF